MIERTDKSRFTFTQIDNRLLQNKELSLQAKGLLCYMLSNVDNWQFTIHSLMVFTGATRAQVRSALLELEDHHYISLCERQVQVLHLYSEGISWQRGRVRILCLMHTVC